MTKEEQIVGFKSFINFREKAKIYKSKYPKERTVLSLALTKLIENTEDQEKESKKEWNSIKNKIEVKYASKEKEGEDGIPLEYTTIVGNAVVTRYKFTGSKKILCDEEVEIARKNFEDTKKFKIHPIYVEEIPKDIDYVFLKAFTGFIFKEMSENEELKWWLAQGNIDNKKSITNGQA